MLAARPACVECRIVEHTYARKRAHTASEVRPAVAVHLPLGATRCFCCAACVTRSVALRSQAGVVCILRGLPDRPQGTRALFLSPDESDAGHLSQVGLGAARPWVTPLRRHATALHELEAAVRRWCSYARKP